jgi:glycosyltransferase involved in cell wall biosynthesis
VQRNSKFVRYLPDFGWQSVVVTGRGSSSDRWAPQDETMAGEVPSGTTIARVSQPEPSSSGGWRGRAERWLNVETRWTKWWTKYAVATALELEVEVDVIFASLVPYESADAAISLSRQLGKPWVADLQDPWALDEMMVFPTGIHRRAGIARMRRVLDAADAVVMNTPESRDRVLAAFPELRSKPVVSITNGYDPADFAAIPPRRSDDTFRIAHTGYLHTELGRQQQRATRARKVLGGEVRGVDILTRSHVYLVEALNRLVERDPSLVRTLELHLAGVLSDADREVVENSQIVRMPGYLTHAESVELIRGADLLFLPMQNLPDGARTTIVPGKTYEYMASGTPLLAAVPAGDARDFLTASGTAIVCGPADVAGMTEALGREIERWREGSPPPSVDPRFLAQFERRNLTRQLAGLLDEVTPSASSGTLT